MWGFCHFSCSMLFVLAILTPHTSTYVIFKWQWDDEDSASGEEVNFDGEEHKANPGESDSQVLHFEGFPTEDRQTVLPASKRTTCNHDSECGYGQFCHRFYKYCERSRYIGELCRRSENCYTGLICMWGRCMKAKMPGTEFSQCKQDMDCKPGMCCGREHGQSVCKKLLQKNEDCSVPEGGLQFSIHGKCPCAPGLACRKTSSIARDWSRMTTMKCQEV